MKYINAFVASAILLHATAHAQQDVNRRVYSFLENHLEVAVLADAPGTLRIVRGEPGRIEVAGRSVDGFSGSALGGHLTPQLRLTAAGADAVDYIVVVPDYVNVRVHLPDGTTTSLAPRAPIGSFRWLAAGLPGTAAAQPFRWSADAPATRPGAGFDAAASAAAQELRMPPEPQLTRPDGSGLFVVHSSSDTPSTVDVPDLASVRSLELRFEGAEFRVAASRPLTMAPGDASRFEIRADGDPVDLVIQVPRDSRHFAVTAAGARIADTTAGTPRALCGNVVVQSPSDSRIWLTFRPQDGRIECGERRGPGTTRQ
jgi:hypothetical protein